MVELNWFLPNLNFTHETSKENVAFLDYNANLNNGMICRELHTKCTDYHQYLHYNSSHPERGVTSASRRWILKNIVRI